jgi:hypothetical protein
VYFVRNVTGGGMLASQETLHHVPHPGTQTGARNGTPILLADDAKKRRVALDADGERKHKLKD